MVWRIEGHPLSSKQHESKQQFNGGCYPLRAAVPIIRPNSPYPDTLSADGDTVIVLRDGRGTATGGLPYENGYAWFMELRGGLVAKDVGRSVIELYGFGDPGSR